MGFRPDRWTTWYRVGDMPLYGGWRADPKGRGEFPRCLSPVPYPDVVRNGMKPPVPRGRFCWLSGNSGLQAHYTPDLEKTPEYRTI